MVWNEEVTRCCPTCLNIIFIWAFICRWHVVVRSEISSLILFGLLQCSFVSRCIGHGIYPGVALLNHSCYSNINKYFVGTTLVAVASRVRISKNTCLLSRRDNWSVQGAAVNNQKSKSKKSVKIIVGLMLLHGDDFEPSLKDSFSQIFLRVA